MKYDYIIVGAGSAGCEAAGVICEVMNEDGSMARRPDLESFAEEHASRSVPSPT